MAGFNLSQLTWQHALLLLLVAVLIYCLIMGCSFDLELLENSPSAEEVQELSGNGSLMAPAPASETEEVEVEGETSQPTVSADSAPIGYSGVTGNSVNYSTL